LKKKISFVISNIDKSLGFEWLAQYLNKDKFDIEFIFLNPVKPAIQFLFESRNIKTKFIPLKNKTGIPVVIFKLAFHFLKTKPSIVHAHLFEGSLCGMIAARICGIKKRIYTRHHSTLHHVEHPSAVKYDRLINRLATDIVAVTENVSTVLTKMEGVNQSKVSVIHHGFPLTEFDRNKISQERVTGIIQKYNPGNRRPVIGVISRYVEWKGIQYIIPAFKKLLNVYPDALLLLANAKGNYSTDIRKMLAVLPANSFIEIEFENDIFALYTLFNIFIHVPVRKDAEAFGQIYIEAMAAGIPMICTQSGVSPEIIVDKQNALVVSYCSNVEIYNALMYLLGNPQVAENIAHIAINSVKGKFTVEEMIETLEDLYER
jgi:glycosyltransferase involved in cell wall biosynthesis